MITFNTLEESKTGINFAKSYDLDKINIIIKELTDFVNSPNEFLEKNEKRYTKNYAKEALDCLNKELENRTWIPTDKTEPTVQTEQNVNKTKPANVKKNFTKNTLTKSKTTIKKENKTIKKNEIHSLVKSVTIAPNAVKKIVMAQKKNKTNADARYWGGWATVRTGMNAAYNDYAKYDVLQTEWHELCAKMGGKKSPLYHFCWKLINKNRVGVKQEPNSTLRFIKNVKIRIAMANDVLANQKKYKNEIAENWKATFGVEL